MRPFGNTLRFLALFAIAAALMAKPKGGGGDNDSGSGGGPKRKHGGGSSDSVGQVQKKARTSAEQLDPDSASSNDTDPNKDSDGDGDPTNDNDTREPLPRDENGRPIVDRRDPDQMRQLFEESSRDENGRIPQDELPKGWGYDENGVMHDNRGHKTGDPDQINQSLRSKYFPDGFTQKTHDSMVRDYTSEARNNDGQVHETTQNQVPNGKIPSDGTSDAPPVKYKVVDGVPYVVDQDGNPTSQRVDRNRLTWHEDKDHNNPIPYYRENSDGKTVTNVQYDHHQSAAEYWNKGGYDKPYDERAEWYNNPDNLNPMGSKENGGKGSIDENGERYRYDKQQPGPNYTPKPGKG